MAVHREWGPLCAAAWLICAVAGMTPVNVTAGGFQISELCGVCQGKRNAGSAASADSPATIYFNPANLSWLEGTQLDFSAHYIDGTFNFNNTDSTNIDGEPLKGTPNKNGSEPAVVGSLSFSHQFNDRWSAGVVATVPYGLVTDYNSDWIGRYNANKSDLKTILINPSVSWRFDEHWAVAGGVVWNYADVELSNSIDLGGVLNRLLTGQLPPILLPEPGNPDRDALAKVTGDDNAWGYTLGLMWEPRVGTRIGVGYRSKIDLTLEGDLKIRPSSGLSDFVAGLPVDPGLEPVNVDGQADLTLPESVWSSVYHEINDRWRIMASATWSRWTRFDQIVIELPGDAEIVQPEGWNNQWRVGAGAEWDFTDRLTFRGGFEYDETPVHPSSNTARIPDDDRVWFAFGATWRPGGADRLSVDFAYTRIFLNDYSIREKEVFTSQTLHAITGEDYDDGNTLAGTYRSHANVYSIGLRYRFGGD
jgi:long-chain fatty acid transport protein